MRFQAGTIERAIELGYAQRISSYAPVLTAGASSDIPGLTTTVTVTDRPIRIEAFVPVMLHSVANSQATLVIWDVATGASVSQAAGAVPTNGTPFTASCRLNPAAGERTYKAQIKTGTAGTVTAFASATFPAYIQIVEV